MSESLPHPARITAPQWVLGSCLAIYFACMLLVERLDSETILIIVLWGLGLCFVPKWRAPLSGFEKALFLSFAVFFLTVLLSWFVNGMPEQGGSLLSRYFRFLLFVPVYLVVRNHARLWMLWWGALLGTLVGGIWGILEFAHIVPELSPDSANRNRVGGAVNEIHYGMLMLLMGGIVACGGAYFKDHGKWVFALALIGFSLGVLGCLLSVSRGALLFLPVFAIVIVIAIFKTRVLAPRTVVILVAVNLIAAAAILPFTIFPEKLRAGWSAYHSYQQTGALAHRSAEGYRDYSVGTRLEMWRHAIVMFREHPVTGVGPGAYKSELQKLAAAGKATDEITQFSHPHNEYLDFLSGGGLLGLLGMLLVYLVPLGKYWRSAGNKDIRIVALAMAGMLVILGYLHYGITSALLQRTTMMTFFLVSQALIMGSLCRLESEHPGSGSRNRTN